MNEEFSLDDFLAEYEKQRRFDYEEYKRDLLSNWGGCNHDTPSVGSEVTIYLNTNVKGRKVHEECNRTINRGLRTEN